MSLQALHKATYLPTDLPVPGTMQPRTDNESGKSVVGMTGKGTFVRPGKNVNHRAIMGITGAGKTTLAQTLKEIDLHRKRKVIEIEPALEAKCEGVFMNMPNNDPDMVRILRKDFNLEPQGFKTIAYTPPTAEYYEFIDEYPEMSEFFQPIKYTMDDLKNILLKVMPGGPIERMMLKRTMDISEGENLFELAESIENDTSSPAYLQQSAYKISYIASLDVVSDKGVSIKKILQEKHNSIITFAFIDDPLDRFMTSLIYLTTIYETWKRMPHNRILSFYVADANLFAPAKKKDMLDSLSRYQERARSQLQVYARISRGQKLAWTMDFQEWGDIDEGVRAQMIERFFKQSWSTEVARMLDIEPYKLRRMGKPYTYYHNMRELKRLKIRPPMSRKAREGQFTPQDFAKEFRRYQDEEANNNI